MKVPAWLRRVHQGESREEDRALAREFKLGLGLLQQSPGWAHIKSLALEEAQGCMTELCEQVSERRRDYLASRVQALNWILDLPGQKIAEYEEMLGEPKDDPEAREEGNHLDWLSPVPPN